jgi:hypothetical protein
MDNKTKEIRRLKDMQLHDEIGINSAITVIRVPGGWIYEIKRGHTNRVTSQFIPFCHETNTSLM